MNNFLQAKECFILTEGDACRANLFCHLRPICDIAVRDVYGGCDASLNVEEFENIALGHDCRNSNNCSDRTAAAAAATSTGHLMRVFTPENFPIQNAVVTQHAHVAATVAAATASRADTEAAVASSSQTGVCDSEPLEAALSLSDSLSTCHPMAVVDAAHSTSFSSANLAAAASSASDKFRRSSFRFALDIAPSLLLALGPAVASIIKSGVGKKYLEFKALRATYVVYGDSLLLLPASKGEIFSSQNLSLMDKRSLMKFFKAIGPVTDAGADAGAEKRMNESGCNLEGFSLVEVMTRHGLDERLQAFVAYGMAGVARLTGTSASDGISSIAAYLQSIGRYSDSSPFLYCCYGSGEMAQAYCRMAAVYGGLYVLRRSISSIHYEDASQVKSDEPCRDSSLLSQQESSEECEMKQQTHCTRVKGVLLTDGQYVKAAHVISSAECWPVSQSVDADLTASSNVDFILRAIVISSSPISLPPDSSANTNSDPGAPILVCIPPQSTPSTSIITSCVRLLQLGSSCQVSFSVVVSCPCCILSSETSRSGMSRRVLRHSCAVQCSCRSCRSLASRIAAKGDFGSFLAWCCFVKPHLQICALLPFDKWLWSATYVTRFHPVSANDSVRGLHAITAVSAANITTQLYVNEAEAAFKSVCGQSSDFLMSMQTEEEEEGEAAAVTASATNVAVAAAATVEVEADSLSASFSDTVLNFEESMTPSSLSISAVSQSNAAAANESQ